MAVTTTNLGVITAYGDAVAAGYTGTKAEWQALMASYATVGQQAVDAKNTAVQAKDTAVAKATEATTAANTATTKAGEADASAQSIAQSAAQIQENTDDIDELKNTLNEDIKYSTGVDSIAIKVKNKFLRIVSNTIDVNNPMTSPTGYGYVIVPCVAGDIFTVSGISSNENPRAWAFTDANYTILNIAEPNISVTNERIIAPPNSAYLVIHDKTPYRESFKGDSVLTLIDETNEVMDFITGGIKKVSFLENYFYTNISNRKVNIEAPYPSTSGYSCAKISCAAGDTFTVSGQSGTTSPYAWAFTDTNGYIIDSSALSGQIVENLRVVAPVGSAFLIINKKNQPIPYYGHPFNDDIVSLSEDIETVSDLALGQKHQINNTVNGSYVSNGSFVYKSNRLRYSEILKIYPNMSISFMPGTIINNMLVGTRTEAETSFADSQWFSADTVLSYNEITYVILVFRAYDDRDLSPSDFDATLILKAESSTTGNEILPTSYPQEVGYRKTQQYVNLKWTPKEQVPKQGGATYFPANVERNGMLYSEPYKIGKIVGFDVSIRTFMTAVNNPYSLLYTENINADHSQSAYGITYTGNANAGAYYGTSCDEFVTMALGCVIPYHNGDINGWARDAGIFEKIYNQSATGLELMDIVSNPDHCLIVTRLWKNDRGIVNAVQLSESVGNGVHNTAIMTNNEFRNLINQNDYIIYRYKYLYKNIKYEKSPFVAVEDETITPYTYNNDICTFAGDYASFAEGDMLYINYTKGTYTSMEIYKNDVLLETIALDADSSVHSLDLTNRNYEYGKYKARLTGNGSQSEYTYFEIIKATPSIIGNTLYANAENAEPLYWGWVNNTLGSAQKYEFTSDTADISQPHETGYDNILVVYGGVYGRIRKVITP